MPLWIPFLPPVLGSSASSVWAQPWRPPAPPHVIHLGARSHPAGRVGATRQAATLNEPTGIDGNGAHRPANREPRKTS